jgi:hypothetical protein
MNKLGLTAITLLVPLLGACAPQAEPHGDSPATAAVSSADCAAGSAAILYGQITMTDEVLATLPRDLVAPLQGIAVVFAGNDAAVNASTNDVGTYHLAVPRAGEGTLTFVLPAGSLAGDTVTMDGVLGECGLPDRYDATIYVLADGTPGVERN